MDIVREDKAYRRSPGKDNPRMMPNRSESVMIDFKYKKTAVETEAESIKKSHCFRENNLSQLGKMVINFVTSGILLIYRGIRSNVNVTVVGKVDD